MPKISVIVPCFNEQASIALLLDGLMRQRVDLSTVEVILADGRSTDATRAIAQDWSAAHPELAVRLVDNPARNIPAGLNAALSAAQGEYIVRLDAHSVPVEDYLARCVRALEAGLGDNVGGVWMIRPQGESWQARSIAAAAAHPLGVGDALYRFTTQAAYVDTVPFGAFRKDLFERVGRFDETLLTNEDYELNTRIRAAGGKVWLDPAIRSTYFARKTFADLARQYGRYGFWKYRMLRRYPGTLRWRQALPPVFTAGVVTLAAASIFLPLARWLLGLGLAVYFLLLFLASIRPAQKAGDIRLAFGIPIAISVMHLSWGGGFLSSIISGLYPKKRTTT